MNFHSTNWKSEASSKTFVPESAEAGLVAETVKRIGELLEISGKEQTLTEIVTVALYEAQEMIVNRLDS